MAYETTATAEEIGQEVLRWLTYAEDHAPLTESSVYASRKESMLIALVCRVENRVASS